MLDSVTTSNDEARDAADDGNGNDEVLVSDGPFEFLGCYRDGGSRVRFACRGRIPLACTAELYAEIISRPRRREIDGDTGEKRR